MDTAAPERPRAGIPESELQKERGGRNRPRGQVRVMLGAKIITGTLTVFTIGTAPHLRPCLSLITNRSRRSAAAGLRGPPGTEWPGCSINTFSLING